jgi:hypothetical protein
MSIAAAMTISAFYLGLHLTYQPFEKPVLNRLQTLALTVLTLLYFIGVLLKTETVDDEDRESLGVLMLLLLLSVFLSVIMATWSEVRTVMQWVHQIHYAKAEVEMSPVFDPSLKDSIIAVSELQMGDVIGQGSEGLVRKAIFAGYEVAVKVSNVNHYSSTPTVDLLRAAQAEAQVLQPLRHPVSM